MTAKKRATHKTKSYKFGIISEIIAAFFLRFKGYKIICRNYKTRLGEIDIIAQKKGYIIAVEVKARRNKINVGEILTLYQKKRIKNAFKIFLSNRNYSSFGARFDLIIIFPWQKPIHLLGFWE